MYIEFLLKLVGSTFTFTMIVVMLWDFDEKLVERIKEQLTLQIRDGEDGDRQTLVEASEAILHATISQKLNIWAALKSNL